jgi:Flp pilus assembly protein TadD
MIQEADRPGASSVGTRMHARLGRIGCVVALAAAIAACGGRSKKKATTPDQGGDAVGMKDGDPIDDGAPGPGSDGQPGGSGGGDGAVLPDDGGDGGGSTTAPKEPEPKFTPTNVDPDPEQARAGVQKHLRTARDALRGTRPDPDLAVGEAKAALAIDGTSIDAVAVLAHAYYHKKLYDTAETILDQVFRRPAAQKHAGVYYVYGLVYDKQDKRLEAGKAFARAVELKPDYGSALVNLGVHQLRNKQYDAAIGSYEKLVNSLGYADARTWNGLGSAYRGKSAEYEADSTQRADYLLKAEAAYQRSRTADANYGMAYYNLGLLYLDADPFPAPGGGNLDTLIRLNKAKTYFEEYKNMPGVDIKLFDERMKNVTKLIKRVEKSRKKKGSDD